MSAPREATAAHAPAMAAPLLSVRDLSVAFGSERGTFLAVDRVSFEVAIGETLAIVGESGSGKSATALAVAGLLPPRRATVTAASIALDGRELSGARGDDLRRTRAESLGMVFQNPMSSLNPVMSVGDQIGEGLRINRGMSRREARRRAIELLRLVRIPAAEKRVDDYPHRLSGGMRQRVMIAIALASSPKLLIADEPTTALDVTTQAQILDLLREIQAESNMAIVLITHDLGVVSEFADRVAVFYCGRVVETAATSDLFGAPAHPYTRALLDSVRSLHSPPETPLYSIPGVVPPAAARPSGCVFRTRCDRVVDVCAVTKPELSPAGPGHMAACLRLDTVDRP
jgi:peptide/nickel transport system ATP-binding protein